MNKYKKIILRIVILSIVCSLVLGLFLFFNYKEEDKNIEWNWEKEGNVVYGMLKKKYPNVKSENFPVILMKNQDIPKKNKDEKRILIVGDSYVYGYSDTNVNYTWWKQLNLQIKEAGYSNINIYATGRYFFNTKDEFEKILKNEDLMKKIDPDLVIIGYVYNDPEVRDKTNRRNLIPDNYEIVVENNEIYKKDPNLYYELIDKANSLGQDEYDKLKEIGDILGFYRWDIRSLVLVEDGRLEEYKNILGNIDERMKELKIPYFYLFLDNIDNSFIKKAQEVVYNAMKELSIDAYYKPFNLEETLTKYNLNDWQMLHANPADSHPGIIWTQEYGKMTYDILTYNYNFLFDNAIIQDINELEININDTMPFLNVQKIKNNVFEFEYPMYEKEKDEYNTNFLYYPIKKDYVKLNLEYPKNISKIKVTGDNLQNAEIYVNTIDKEYGFDINEAKRVLTLCENLGNNVYEVDNEITSVSIVAKFKSRRNRKIKIEFIEE